MATPTRTAAPLPARQVSAGVRRRLEGISLKPVVLIALVVVYAANVRTNWSAQPSSENRLLGPWYYESGPCSFEVFTLTLEGGRHVFQSWVHERPDSMGSWSLSGRILVIHLDHGDTVTWELVSVGSSDLLVKAKGEAGKSRYTRKPTRALGEPEDNGQS